MRCALSKLAQSFWVAVLVAALGVPRSLMAQSAPHVVSPDDLQKATVEAWQARQQNIDTLNQLFSSDQGRQALQSARVDPQEVKTAVAGMSDEELAQLASRARQAQADFAAGGLVTGLIILAVLVIVIAIIVGVH